MASRLNHEGPKTVNGLGHSRSDREETRQHWQARDVLSFRENYVHGHIEAHVHALYRRRRCHYDRVCLWFLCDYRALRDCHARNRWDSDVQASMLVDIREAVERPERVRSGLWIPSITGLQFVDDCHGLPIYCSDPLSPLSLPFPFPVAIRVIKDGETDVIRVSEPHRQRGDLEDRVVKGRMEVLRAIADHDAPSRPRLDSRLKRRALSGLDLLLMRTKMEVRVHDSVIFGLQAPVLILCAAKFRARRVSESDERHGRLTFDDWSIEDAEDQAGSRNTRPDARRVLP